MKNLLISLITLLISISSYAAVKAESVITWLTADSVSRTFDSSMSNGQLILAGLGIIAVIFLIGFVGAKAEMKKEKARKTKRRRNLRTSRA